MSCCLAKSISVLVTFLAFEENQRVTTITIPATNNNIVGVGTFSERNAIENSVACIPETLHASYDCQAAIGTPMKFTKSFPAKAKANEKVPTPIIIL